MGGNIKRQIIEAYPIGFVKKIVENLGIRIISQNLDQINTLCPWHYDTKPSFTISTKTGQSHCFNPSCNISKSLLDLTIGLGKMNHLEALRFLAHSGPNENEVFFDELSSLLKDEDEFQPFDADLVKNLNANLSQRAIDYMNRRGITEESVRYFNMGFSKEMDMISLPLYSHTNVLVGMVGRSIEGKFFKYSLGCPTSRIWFNLNKARKESSSVIIVEASFDAIKIHQSGYPNVIAILGSQTPDYKMKLLNRYFDKIIIMTDFDGKKIYEKCSVCKSACQGHDPGRDAGARIRANFDREVLWAVTDSDTIYPRSAKDPGEMTETEIRTCIKNSIPDYEYQQYFML